MMPQMSGPELIEALKSDNELNSVPIILLTAKSDEESKLIGTEIGADSFLGKPFNDQELGSIVKNLLSLKSREREVEKLNHMLTETVLKRYISPVLVDKIIAGEISMDKPAEMRRITVLFSDLSGFTKTSEQLGPQVISSFLNEYLTKMNDIIFEHGGTVDKFIGDAIMVMFGAPQDMPAEEQAKRAADCALAMQREMQRIAKDWETEGAGHLRMRIGLHQGEAIVGNFGSDKRSDYTCIGPTVNLAARIETAGEAGHVYLSGELKELLPQESTAVAGAFELKGIEGKTTLYKLV
jgi:adenylate cyclase